MIQRTYPNNLIISTNTKYKLHEPLAPIGSHWYHKFKKKNTSTNVEKPIITHK